MRIRLLIFLFLPLIIFSQRVQAQDAHYWTEHFGTRSMLLNGVVIGSVEDLGAVYYNPSRIAIMKQPTFVISAKVYQRNRMVVKNGLGNNTDLVDSRFGSGPSLVSGTFRIKKWPKHNFAYAFLVRENVNQNLSYGLFDEGNYLNAFAGEEYFNASVNFNKEIRDEWIGGSWSYAIDEKWAVGVSGFYSDRKFGVTYQEYLRAYNSVEGTGVYNRTATYSTNVQSILGKIGLSYRTEKMSFGLTITTPKLKLIDDGNLSYEKLLSGVDTTGDGITDDEYLFKAEDGLNVKNRTPWAIGLGTGIRLGKSILHISAEYYTKVKKYEVLVAQTTFGQSNGAPLNYTVFDERNDVLNAGAGIEIFVNKKFSLFGSFATDFSSVDKDNIIPFTQLKNESSVSSFKAPVYHSGIGVMLDTKFVEFTLGTTLALSTSKVNRSITIPNGTDVDFSTNTDEINTVKYSRWRFMFGFSFKFLEGKLKEIEVE